MKEPGRKMLDKKPYATKEQLLGLQQQYVDLEKNINLRFSDFEYKLWQNNTYLNYFLYDLYLKDKNKKQDFHPLVSIIIPLYNGSNFLSNAIDSALSQTYDNIEIIVVNDGSTDNGVGANIVRQYGDRLFYYEKKNGGVSSALNYGISKMCGDYFAWLSHDDIMEPDHIKNLVDFYSYKEHDKMIPFCGFKIINEDGSINFEKTISLQLHCYDFKTSYYKNEFNILQGEINGGSILIPRHAFEKCGLFDEELKITQERDMWSRLIKKFHLINIPFDTALIREHASQVSNTNKDIAEKSNQKNLEIIQSMISSMDDAIAFLEHIKRFYHDNNNEMMVSNLTEIIEKQKNAQNKNS